MKKPEQEKNLNNHRHHPAEALLDEAGEESFPASDPLAWNLGSGHLLSLAMERESGDIVPLLAKEHALIKKVTHAILMLIKEISVAHRVDMQSIKQLSDFFYHFVEQYHHQKEERLYALLQKMKERPSDYVLNDLLQEHAYGKKLLSHLQALSEKKFSVKDGKEEELIHLLKDMHHFYLTHIEKEEEYILPVIHQLIDKEKQKVLLGQLEKIDDALGKNEFERLVTLAEKITEKQ